jgi:hypothetical protein
MLDRRTVTAMLAGSVVAPKFALAADGKQDSALYSGAGNELTHYEVDAAAAAAFWGNSSSPIRAELCLHATLPRT